MRFQITLYHLLCQDLATPPGAVIDAWEKSCDGDPRRRLQQTLHLVGLAVNKLRNTEERARGRPFCRW